MNFLRESVFTSYQSVASPEKWLNWKIIVKYYQVLSGNAAFYLQTIRALRIRHNNKANWQSQLHRTIGAHSTVIYSNTFSRNFPRATSTNETSNSPKLDSLFHFIDEFTLHCFLDSSHNFSFPNYFNRHRKKNYSFFVAFLELSLDPSW